jgi:hypothetical protein
MYPQLSPVKPVQPTGIDLSQDGTLQQPDFTSISNESNAFAANFRPPQDLDARCDLMNRLLFGCSVGSLGDVVAGDQASGIDAILRSEVGRQVRRWRVLDYGLSVASGRPKFELDWLREFYFD